MPPKTRYTRKPATRQAKKNSDNVQVGLDSPEPLASLPKPKKTRKSYKTKAKENTDPNLATGEILNQPEFSPSEKIQSGQQTLNEYQQQCNLPPVDQQTHINSVREDFQKQGSQPYSLNYHCEADSSFTANAYKHKVPSPLKPKFQLIEPNFSDDGSSDDDFFSSINLNNNISSQKSLEKDPLATLNTISNNAFNASTVSSMRHELCPITQQNKVDTMVSPMRRELYPITQQNKMDTTVLPMRRELYPITQQNKMDTTVLPMGHELHPITQQNEVDLPTRNGLHPIIQQNEVDSPTRNGLFFQDETHLIQWLKMHKDLILQALNAIFSLPAISNQSVISNQISTNNTSNLAKILSEQSRILFLRTRMPTKRTRTLLIKSVIPNMVKTHPNWNEVSTKLRQAFENFRSTYNDDIAKLANQLIRKKSNPSDIDIESFIDGTVWEKPLKKHIDILDYDVFKNSQFGIKALKTFVSKSLKIHMMYLIAESNGKHPDYNSIVLNHIKALDNITIDLTFPAASYLQHANQLELQEEREKLEI